MMEVDSASTSEPYWVSKPSIAPIKSEYVLWDRLAPGSRPAAGLDDDDAAEGRPSANGDQKPASDLTRSSEVRKSDADSPPRKKAKSEHAHLSGQNKGRKFKRAQEEIKLCNATARGLPCPRENLSDGCRNSHDLKQYLESSKDDEIEIAGTSTSSKKRLECPSFANLGACPFGFRCRMLSSHVTKHDDPSAGFQSSGLSLVYNFDKLRSVAPSSLSPSSAASKEELLAWVYETRGEMNVVTPERLYAIRKTKVQDLPLTREYLTSIGEPLDTRNLDGGGRGRGRGRGGKRGGGRGGRDAGWQDRNGSNKHEEPALQDEGKSTADGEGKPVTNGDGDPTTNGAGFDEPRATADDLATKEEAIKAKEALPGPTEQLSAATAAEAASTHAADGAKDAPDVPLRSVEKKRLNFENKLYLAPLTTVGNLPFRRLCVSYGCDVTCGEMGLAQEYMTGNKSEWSLVRRHPSEKLFGVQIAANKVQTATSAVELIRGQCPDVDFIDLNCGCPIDLVVKKGAGSALLDNAGKLGKILAGMNAAAGSVPITIKMRTGIRTGVNTTHKLMPRIVRDYGVGAATLHGRTQQQRYSKLADYSYIKTCVDGLRSTAEEMDLAPIPFFGNGDAYDHRTYWDNVRESGLDGIMIARGALIKPWIFTEISERRDWDISSRERLDMIGNLAKFGLEHWGSDTMGVNTTRRFLCEALSFQYRYVPAGLLERLPSRMNDRPYPFRGRDDMETLLASGYSEDWVKISEMFLGPRAPEFVFTPKHKSAGYSKDGEAEESYNG